MGHNPASHNTTDGWPAPTADADLAVRALTALLPTGPANIVWIDPATGAVGGLTRPGVDSHIRAAIADRLDTHNLYFTVNKPHATAPNAKLRKSDIAAVHAVFADLDPAPDAERQRLHAIVNDEIASDCPPAFVIDSGNGLQVIWRVPPATDFARAEALGRGIASALGSDPVQNVDRILRIPYTNNMPPPRKRALGRTTKPTGLLHQRHQVTNNIGDLERRFPPHAAPPARDVAHHPVDWHAAAEPIDPALNTRFAELAKSDSTFATIIAGTHQHAGDKSRMDYALVGRLHDHGFDDQSIATALMHFKHGKTPELLHDDHHEAQRQFDRALARAPHTVPATAEFEIIVGFDPGHPPALNDNARSVFDTGPPETRATLTYERFDDIALPRARNYLIKGLLDTDAMSVIYGASGVGKTHVTLDLAFHVAIGKPWRNMPTEPGLVVYVAAEGGNSLRKRILALRKKYAAEIAATGRVPLAIVAAPVNLLDPKADVQPLIELARQAAADFDCPPAWIIIDTLSRAMAGGNENSSEDMGALVMNADTIRTAFRCHFSFVHHSGKDAAKGARGHSLLRAATDTEIEVEKGETDTRGQISATKQRDMETGPPHEWAIETVGIGTDDDGEPLTSAIAVEPPAGAEFSDDVELAAANDREAEAIARALDREQGPADELEWLALREPAQEAIARYRGKASVSGRTVDGAVQRLFGGGRVVSVRGRTAEYRLSKQGDKATSPRVWIRKFLDFTE